MLHTFSSSIAVLNGLFVLLLIIEASRLLLDFSSARRRAKEAEGILFRCWLYTSQGQLGCARDELDLWFKRTIGKDKGGA